MKKIRKILIVLIVTLLGVMPIVGCKDGLGGDKVINDGKTVNVKVYKAGYGSDYIYDMKEKFEKAFESEGYKINILAPSRDIIGNRVLQDIYGDGGIDVYFTQDVNLQSALRGDYGVCVADLTESVYEKNPIKFDGTEESVTVKEKLNKSTSFDITDGGKYYAMPYVEGIGGLVVNKTALTQYGLDLPRTTKELFHCYDVIMKKANETAVFPYTYISGQNNYPAHLTNMWLAQYAGMDWFEKFWSMVDEENNEMSEKGYELFADPAVTEMLVSMFEAFDPMAAAYGSATQDIAAAQAQVMRGTAVFMSTGDYFFNEESLSFSSKLKDITIINIPVISSLGTKVFGTKYGFDDGKCEEILCDAIDGADSNKTPEEIAAEIGEKYSFDPAVEDVLEICNARGAVYNRTTRQTAVVSAKSEVKDIAALFLRMCASDDGANAISSKTMTGNPFSSSPINANSEYEFLRSAAKITSNRYKRYADAIASGYREKIGLTSIFPFTGIYVQNSVINKGISIYDEETLEVKSQKSIYAAGAKQLAKEISDHAAANWEKWTAAVK